MRYTFPLGPATRAVAAAGIGQRLAQDHGQRLARQFIKTSGIEATIRRVERAQRRRNWHAALRLAVMTGADLEHCMRTIHARLRVLELEGLAEVRTEARTQRRHRPPRGEQDPVLSGHGARAPDDVSSLPYPEVAA
jgi:hypothetical protein